MPTTISPAAAMRGIPNRSLKNTAPIAAPTTGCAEIDLGVCWSWGFGGLVVQRLSVLYSYRYFSESASVCSMSAIVSSGIRS